MERIMEYILCIYAERSFSKAAAQLFITQPALSIMVRKEERRRGVEFFNRNVNPIAPTEAGLEYIQAAMKIQKIEQNLDKRLHSLSNTLTVASSAFFCANVLPKLTDQFAKVQGPSCHIHCIEGSAHELVNYLQEGEADFVISVDDHYGKHVEWKCLKQESILLAAPRTLIPDPALQTLAIPYEAIKKGAYTAPAYPSISLNFFNHQPFILLTKGNDLYYRARKMLRHASVIPSSITYMDQLQSSFLAAQSGKGLVFIRAELANIVGDSNAFYFYKIDDELALRDVKIFYRSTDKMSNLRDDFLKYCMENFK